MNTRVLAMITTALLLFMPGWPVTAWAKNKTILPDYVLRARTVTVMIDPNAGVDLEDPRANQTAQRDVETALMNWGRLDPRLSSQGADLIIVVRKGHSRFVQGTIADPRQNDRPGEITPTDNGVSIGAQHGHQPGTPDTSNSSNNTPRTQAEIANQADLFAVYQAGVDDPLDRSPVWRAKDKKGLHPHDVPAVDEFRKAIAEAEKAAAKNP